MQTEDFLCVIRGLLSIVVYWQWKEVGDDFDTLTTALLDCKTNTTNLQ